MMGTHKEVPLAEQDAPAPTHTSSTGHGMATGDWLDTHFEFSRPEYEVQVRAVGIQPGWRVLDAGCGGGHFLPWLASLVGPTGRVAALDLAPENVATVEARLPTLGLPCPVEARVGSLLALPYPDDAFDAAWCANTTQYLTDAELASALAELRRVVRPGGLVAVKDIDATLMRLTTRNPLLLRCYQDARYRGGAAQARGTWRGPELHPRLTQAGLVDVWAQTTLIERHAPLRPVEKQFLIGVIRAFAATAAGMDLPEEDRAEWAWLHKHAEAWVEDPTYYCREGNVLAVGTVPNA